MSAEPTTVPRKLRLEHTTRTVRAALAAASAEVRREGRELRAQAELEFVDLHVPEGEAPERTAERALELLGS
jgi:hypothetical protein